MLLPCPNFSPTAPRVKTLGVLSENKRAIAQEQKRALARNLIACAAHTNQKKHSRRKESYFPNALVSRKDNFFRRIIRRL